MQKTLHSKGETHKFHLAVDDWDADALKDQFRSEDEELRAQGRGDEIIARNRRLMGIRAGAKSKLAGVGNKLFV